jgi:transcription elongation factor Elf1
LGRRRRRVIRIVKKKLPTVFVCPRCGEEAVRVTIAKDTGKAAVMCAMCQLKDEFQAHPAAQMIDVYSYFADRFYGVKDPRPIIPHERPAQKLSAEEEVSQPESAEELAEPSQPEEPETVTAAQEPQLETQSLHTEPEEASASTSTTIEGVVTEKASETVEESKMQETVETPETPVEADAEDNEPFADILQNKDKKRYSSNPLPEQHSEQST